MRLFILTLLFLASTVQIVPAQSFDIKPIPNQTVSYPQALLLAFQIEGDVPVAQVDFSYQSNIDGAITKGQSIYWKPQISDQGRYQVKIIATAPNGKTAAETFMVEVQSFNTPPRFVPVRQITIPVGHQYSLSVTAFDPDGMNKNLIRYLGVGLPKGATLDEHTGTITWTPTAKQVGKHTFRVIATDQYGAASSTNVTIKVMNISRPSE